MDLKRITVGKGSIVVDNDDFLNGYQSGHMACRLEMKQATFTNTSLTEMMMEKLESMTIPEQYSVGYIVDYISTLALKSPHSPLNENEDEPAQEQEP